MHNLSPQGYRFVNLDSLQGHVSEITMHVCLCPSVIELSSKNQSPIKLVSEERKLGLATVLCAQCEGCHKQFKFCSSPSLPESKRFDVNVRAVWGSIATGNGPSHLNEIMGTMNSPGLSSTSFSATVGEWWLAALQENMLQYIAPTQPGKKTTTGRKKKNTAEQNNDFVSESNIEPSADQTPCTRSRRGRPGLVKFLDKRIEHKWIVDNTSEWYKGTVLSVKSGKDGVKGAIYDVLYDSDDNPYEINHLVEDYRSESVRFIDV